MSQHYLTRRRLLQGAASSFALLPFVPLLEGDARAHQGAGPKRLVVWFYPNGTLPDAYFPGTVGENFELTEILKPLASHRDRLLVTKGVRLNAYDAGVKIVHISCVAPLLTGFTIPDGDHHEGSETYGWAAGPSVDQVVASTIGAQTKFPSLEFHNVGANDEFRTQYRVIYKGAGQPITGMRDPRAAFTRIFGDGMDPDGRMNRSRLSVLDTVSASLKALKPRIGQADQLKMDAHLEAVLALQNRFGDGTGGSCQPPPIDINVKIPPGDCGVNDSPSQACALDDYYAELGKSYMDLIVESFTCDLTRVASLQWGAGGRGSYFKFLDIGENEHLVSHLGASDPKMDPQNGIFMRMKRWYMEQLAYFLDRLKAVPEGNGTMLDNTLVLVCSEHGVGATHSPSNIPFLLAGGGWHFKTGRYLTYNNASNNDLMVSVCNAMGLPLTTFGDPQYCTGPLIGLTG